MSKHAVAALCLLFAASSVHASHGFEYKVPDGWINLADPFASIVGIPYFVVEEARSGKYAVYAVDPEMTTEKGALVSFNAMEQEGTAAVTSPSLLIVSEGMKANLKRAGLRMETKETKIRKLGKVDIGMVISVLETKSGPLQLTQFVIPGKTHMAILTYGCPPESYDHYLPIFESSALATTGAESHGFNLKNVFFAGALGAMFAVIVAAITIVNANRKKTPVPISSSPSMWTCATCNRRVPLRFDVCRCGAARPA